MKKFLSSLAAVLLLSAMASFLTSCEPEATEDDTSLLNGILGGGDVEDTEMLDTGEEEVPFAEGPTYGPDAMPTEEDASEDEADDEDVAADMAASADAAASEVTE